MEEGVDHIPVVPQHLPRCLAYGIPHLIGFRGDTQVDLIARVGVGVEAEGVPAAPVLDREAAGDDRLRPHRGELVRPTRADFGTDDPGNVALDPETIDDGQAAAPRRDVDASAIPAAIRHDEPILGDVDDCNAAESVGP